MTVAEANRKVITLSFNAEKFELLDLLTPKFVSIKTKFKTADELFKCIDFNGTDDFLNMDVSILDNIIASCSEYRSWIEFLQAAYCYHQFPK